MRTAAAIALLSVAVLALACHSNAPLTANQIDQVAGACRARIADGSFSSSQLRSPNLGHREPSDPAGTPVVVYGTSWCQACNVAASYMARRGIPFVEKDIEDDPAAEAARTSTLTLAGLDAKPIAIPVLDVRGTVMRGFFPCVLEDAWAAP